MLPLTRPALLAALTLLIACSLSAQTCAPAWTPNLFADGGVNGPVKALCAFDDDGPGPHQPMLVAGGSFSEAGGFPASNIAAWDGKRWSPLGLGLGGGPIPVVFALAVWDDDGPGPRLPALYAAGGFTMAGGAPASYVARWDGVSWSALGGGISGGTTPGIGSVSTLVELDEDGAGPLPSRLFAGGDFTIADGAPAFGLARWDGTAWSVVGQPGTGGIPQGSIVSQLTAFDPDGAGPAPRLLVAAGYLASTGPTASRVAALVGATWTDLGGTFNNGINVLTTVDFDGPGPQPEVLMVGGSFVSAGGVAANGIAKWTGSAWAPLGSGVAPAGSFGPGVVNAIALFDEDGPGPANPKLFASGGFGAAGGVTSSNIARWNGTAWASTPGGIQGTIEPSGAATLGNALIPFDDDGPGPHAPVLVVGGDFTSANTLSVRCIATWSGTQWGKLGASLDGDVRVLIEYDADGTGGSPPVLVAGGSFSIFTLAGTVAYNLAAWNGLWWAPFGNGPGGTVVAAILFDVDGVPSTPPNLVVARPNGVSYWTGAAWVALGSPGFTVSSLAAFDEDGPGPTPPRVFAGGVLVTGSPPSSTYTPQVKRWTGSAWTAVGGPFATAAPLSLSGVNALAVVDEDGSGPANPVLVAAGIFATAGGTQATNVAKWDGTVWAPLGLGLGTSTEKVASLCVWDPDGPGPAVEKLVAGGTFTISGGTPMNHVATWNGSWRELGGGVASSQGIANVTALASIDVDGTGPSAPILSIGGIFSSAGGVPANGVALWKGAAWTPLGTGVSGGGSPTVPGGAVYALRGFDDDAAGPLAPAIYAGGNFLQAGGASSGHVARWTPDPALSLGLSIPSPSGPLVISNASCVPCGHYFNALSTDPLNATAPGAGILGGLHIATSDLTTQFLSGVAPFVGILDGSGSAQYVVPPSVIAPFAGVTVYGVSVLYSPAPLYPDLTTASAVTSIVL